MLINKIRVTNLTQGGLSAMKELEKLEEERGTPGYMPIAGRRGKARGKGAGATDGSLVSGGEKPGERVASNEMCTFLILNISSLQLIPVNMIAYRQQYGSVNPAGIIGPAIVATFISTIVAVLYCKIMDKSR